MFIQIDNVKKSFGEGQSQTMALRGVNLGIERGELVVIIGPSGCGKSTMLNVLGGLTDVESGRVIVDGQVITGLNSKQLVDYRQEKLGFIFQFYNLIPDLTVMENIQVCGNLTDDPLDANEIMEVLGIAHLRNRFPSELSGGQQQRVAIARALVKNPVLLLCDEPTGALDSKSSSEILRLLEKINMKYGMTVLMVTHNEAITQMADRNIQMKDGRIVRNELNPHRISAVKLEL